MSRYGSKEVAMWLGYVRGDHEKNRIETSPMGATPHGFLYRMHVHCPLDSRM